MPRLNDAAVKTYRNREHEDLLKAAGQRLRKWRLKKELSMPELADMMVDRGHHTDHHQVRNWERGSIPNIQAFQALHSAGLDLNWYLTGKTSGNGNS